MPCDRGSHTVPRVPLACAFHIKRSKNCQFKGYNQNSTSEARTWLKRHGRRKVLLVRGAGCRGPFFMRKRNTASDRELLRTSARRRTQPPAALFCYWTAAAADTAAIPLTTASASETTAAARRPATCPRRLLQTAPRCPARSQRRGRPRCRPRRTPPHTAARRPRTARPHLPGA